MTAAAADDRDRVGPYRVIKAIGAGGSARIDLARIDRAYGFQRHVVVKRPLEHLRGDAQVAASLRREARIGGQLRHPNLVAILDAGVHDGYDYLVLEYVHGAALRTVMLGDAPGQVRELPLGVALAIISDAARGMHEAHELTDERGAPLGLVHRDVSPGNILLGLDGTVKLADFGIAKETRISTLSGSMHGTVTYMAPEQCQGHAYDRRADVFSLGVILYELITGTRLFWADNDVASLHRVLSGAVPRPRTVKPQIASALEDIAMTAVAHAAERRFATALDLATAVEAYAVSAGEVLGARWIARCVEAIVGPKPVPWITATPAGGTPAVALPVGVLPVGALPAGGLPASAASDAPLSGDVSLVALIAAAGADEPVEPGFGDGDTGDEPEAGATRAASAPSVVPAAMAGPRRHSRARLAAIIAAGVIAGSAAGAVAVMMRGSEPAAASLAPAALPANSPHAAGASPPTADSAQRANASPPAAGSAQATAASPPATTPAQPAGAVASPTADPAASPPTADPAASPPTANSTAAVPPTAAAPSNAVQGDHGTASPGEVPRNRAKDRVVAPASRERPGRRAPASAAPSRDGDRAANAKRKRPPDQPAPEPAPAAAEAAPSDPAPPPAAGSAVPPAPPPTNIEWKPTLLLPTDGSGGKPHQ